MARQRLAKLDPEVRGRILGAARREFAARGFEQASLNVIIEHALISKGVLYYYFEDKLDLYLAVIGEVTTGQDGLVAALAFGESSGDYWRDLWHLSRHRAKQMLADPDLARLFEDLYRLAQRPAPNPFHAYFELERGWARAFVASGIAQGAVRTDVVPDTLVAMAFAISSRLSRYVFDKPEVTEADLDRYADLLVDILRRMVAPRPASA